MDELEWSLHDGFVAITGETGSGKSIIIGALKLILGERAEKTLIRTGAESCTVEALFTLGPEADPAPLNQWLEAQGVEPCEEGELIIKRTFSHSGANRQFINSSPTTRAVLKELGDSLIDLHGPHDHQSLFSGEKQLALLDAFAGALPQRQQYEAHYRRWLDLRAEHEALTSGEAALERELDLLRHQVAEIEAAALMDGEEEALLARYQVAGNGQRLVELATRIALRLSEGEEALLPGLEELTRSFRELEKLDPAVAALTGRYEAAVSELEDLAHSLRQYAEGIDLDAGALATLEERINTFETLKRKYGPGFNDVIAFGQEAARRLHRIETRGEECERLAAAIAQEESALRKAGEALGAKRNRAAPKLSADVGRQLGDLGFRKSEFAIVLTKNENPGPHGLEFAEFLFSPNPGEPAKPLKAVASSGEISRVMLALKSSLAGQDEVALLVFDEIDANVGGEIAHTVGAKMRELGRRHQVLCITHLPQVAASAASQFVVHKAFEEERTVSRLMEVTGGEREEEIARMLGGRSDSALAHARELLGQK